MKRLVWLLILGFTLLLQHPNPSFAVHRVATLYDFWSNVQDVAVQGDRALLAVPSHGLILMDISDLEQPEVLSVVPVSSAPVQIELIDSIFYVLLEDGGVGYELTDEDELVELEGISFGSEGLHEVIWWQDPYLITRGAEYGTWGPFPYADIYLTVYEMQEDGTLGYVTDYWWQYGDYIQEITGVTYVDPYLFLAISGEGTVRVGDGDEEHVEQPGGEFFTFVDGYLYSASQGTVEIFNMADPANPQLVSELESDFFGNYRRDGNRLYGGWEAVPYWGDNGAVSVYNISDPTAPTLIGEYDPLNGVPHCFLRGNTAFMSGQELRTWSMTDPFDWDLVHETDNTDFVQSVATTGNVAYLHLSGGDSPVIDISNPTSPEPNGTTLNSLGIGARPWGVVGDYLFTLRSSTTIAICSMENETLPVEVGTYTSENGSGVTMPFHLYETVYAISSHPWLTLVNLADPSEPVVIAEYDSLSLSAMDNLRGLKRRNGTLEAWNLNQPTNPTLTSVFEDTAFGSPYAVTLDGHYACVLFGKYYYSDEIMDGWTRSTLVGISYEDWENPEVIWSADAGIDRNYFFGPRYGRYQVLIERKYAANDQFRLLNVQSASMSGWSIATDHLYNTAVNFPYILTAEGRWMGVYDASDFMTVGVDEVDQLAPLPTCITLLPAYPNPFNAGTMVRYNMPNASHATIRVFDLLGRQVRLLENGNSPGGSRQVYWDGRSDSGSPVASGVYLVRLESADQRAVRKVTLIK